MIGELQNKLKTILADETEDDVMDREWPKVREMLNDRISQISHDAKLWDRQGKKDDDDDNDRRSDNERELVFIKQALTSETFDKYPPFTIQRLAELVLNPLDHYNSVGKWLRAVEKCLTVFSTTHRFSSTKRKSIPASPIGSSSFPGSLDLTTTSIQLVPIPWLADSDENLQDDHISSPPTAIKRSSSQVQDGTISSHTATEGEPSPKLLRTK